MWLPAILLAAAIALGFQAWVRGRSMPVLALGVMCLLAAGLIWLTISTRPNPPQVARTRANGSPLPQRLEPKFGYVGSSACRECHPSEFESWHSSYHRTMTQPATPDSVRAPFENVVLERDGWTYRLERRGDEYWIDMVDPDWERDQLLSNGRPLANPPRAKRQVVLVTGSHHKQTYWVQSSEGTFLCRVPFTWRIDDGRWIPMESDFLAPPNVGRGFSTWDNSCIQCHAVAGQPRENPSTGWDAHVAELGIACEACHGPGSQHVLRRQVPSAGTKIVASAQPDERDIVNPRHLSPRRVAQVCGQCHSAIALKDYPTFAATGRSYRPGDELTDSVDILYYTERPAERWLWELLQAEPDALTNRFWRDGAIRVTGREYNGLVNSACSARGELTCLSCHSMHHYLERDDQLARDRTGNEACLQCHADYRVNLQQHTHHNGNSSGSLCYNCHMPHTTYGLFKAVRAHRIDSPSATKSLRTGRPNACNLCHLDRSLEWTAQALAEWYGQARPTLPEEHRSTAASVTWLLKGDAAQRAIAAWHLGWRPALETSGDDWQAPLLAQVLDDPYSAVRNVAGRSLRKLPGFVEFNFDFLADGKKLSAARQRAIEVWRQQRIENVDVRPCVPVTADGALNDSKIEVLKRSRDDRPLFITE